MSVPIHTNPLPVPLEPGHLHQVSNFHIGIVKDVKDPMGRGRVRVEAKSLFDDVDQANWCNWAEVCLFPVGGFKAGGDHGFWWVPLSGEIVALGFLGGDYCYPIVLPFSAPQAGPDEKNAMIPLEAKAIGDKDIREGTRIRVIKTEAGHTLFWDDRGTYEKMLLMDWTGSGFFSFCPGKKEDEKEKKNEESQPRKGETRGTKTVVGGTSKKPSEIIDGGTQILGCWDLNGQGIMSLAKDDAGTVVIHAAKEKGKVDCYAVFMSAGPLIVLGAGDTQIHINGKDGHIYVTSQIIQNQEKIDVEPLIKSVQKLLGKAMEEYDGKPGKPEPQPFEECIV